jgi:hypothetical protein
VELEVPAKQTSGVAAYWKNQYQAGKKGLWWGVEETFLMAHHNMRFSLVTQFQSHARNPSTYTDHRRGPRWQMRRRRVRFCFQCMMHFDVEIHTPEFWNSTCVGNSGSLASFFTHTMVWKHRIFFCLSGRIRSKDPGWNSLPVQVFVITHCS